MKKLIISANPSTNWFTHQIVKRLNELSIENGHEAKILDLYQTWVVQYYLTYEDKKDIWKDKQTIVMQELITWADELIFVFPIWWWDMPAIMKNFWDTNFTVWFAYNYLKWWKNIWLLNWKQVRVIATSWSPAFLFRFVLPLPFIWRFFRVWFCWMKLKSFTIFWSMDNSKTDRTKYLYKIDKLV